MKLYLYIWLGLSIRPCTQTSYYAIEVQPPLTDIPTDIPTNVTQVVINYNRQLAFVNNSAFSLYSNLTVADLNHNFINYVESLAFLGTNLKELYLYDNELTAIPVIAHPPTVIVLQVGWNKISSVSLGDLSSYPDLEELDISKNYIRWTTTNLGGIFDVSLTLVSLDLSETDGPELNITADLNLFPLPNLEDLYISYVDYLPNIPVLFPNVTHLHLLELAGYSFTNAEVEIYLNTSRLTTNQLILDDNGLNNIPAFLPAMQSVLEELSLRENSLESVAQSRLKGMTALERLDLSGNSIEAFPDFPNLPTMKNLSLVDNGISYIPEHPFYNLSSLLMLDIHDNPITEVADLSPVLSSMPSTFHLDVTGAMFSCNCSFLFLLEAIQGLHPLSVSVDLYPCATPTALVTRTAANITREDICPESTVTCKPIPTWGNIVSDTTEVSPGDTIEYRCTEGYIFSSGDTSVSQTNVCDADSGDWLNEFDWCEEDTSENSDDDEPTEAADGVMIGSLVILFVGAEITFLVLIDIPALKRSCHRGRMNCKNKSKKDIPGVVIALEAGHS